MWAAVQAYLCEAGFDRVIYMSFSEGAFSPSIRTTMPDSFLEVYQKEGFAKDDPFITYCLPSKESIRTGIAYIDDYKYLSKRSASLIEAAAEYGFNAGTSVSLYGNRSASREGWNLGSSLKRCEIEQIWRCRGTELRLALHALSGLLISDCAELTEREVAVLGLYVEGRRTKQVAIELGIAPVTVDFHLKNARHKLGVGTRDAAVAKFVALSRGQTNA
jgi:DNA-binding CsgD family transcriptional regulator